MVRASILQSKQSPDQINGNRVLNRIVVAACVTAKIHTLSLYEDSSDLSKKKKQEESEPEVMWCRN